VLDTFRILGIEFPAYFTLLLGGYTVVVWLALRDAPRLGIGHNDLLDLALVLILAGIVGARVLHVAADGYFMDYVHLCTDPFAVKGENLPRGKRCAADEDCRPLAERGFPVCNPDTGTCHQGRDCLRAFKFWYGGLTYYGGLALAIPVGIAFIRRRRMPLWRIADLAGWGIPLGLFFGRIGCLLAGCCYGRPDDGPLGMSFPRGSPAWERHVEEGLIARAADHSLPVVPTQALESFASLGIFLFLYGWLRRRARFDGELFFVSCMLYAAARFLLEFWRDDPRGGIWGLSTSQWLGIPLFLYGLFEWIRRARSPAASG
jgi:phosphatidylglycerol:prolipoprotein diacylglycerol transferase